MSAPYRIVAVDSHGNEIGPNKFSGVQSQAFFDLIFGRRDVTLQVERDGTVRVVLSPKES